ncbi:hypothetical protein ACI48J_02945 [Paenibacillus chitinolyticus]|uniref:hypothetical protein n=1 Tax=Paenibacillus chitinolyticus TaxID=79263 RepID=UPI003868C1BE
MSRRMLEVICRSGAAARLERGALLPEQEQTDARSDLTERASRTPEAGALLPEYEQTDAQRDPAKHHPRAPGARGKATRTPGTASARIRRPRSRTQKDVQNCRQFCTSFSCPRPLAYPSRRHAKKAGTAGAAYSPSKLKSSSLSGSTRSART